MVHTRQQKDADKEKSSRTWLCRCAHVGVAESQPYAAVLLFATLPAGVILTNTRHMPHLHHTKMRSDGAHPATKRF
jgi:hypothetical protein